MSEKLYRFKIVAQWGPEKGKPVPRCYRYNGKALSDEDSHSFIADMATEADVLRFIQHGMRGYDLTVETP